MRKSLKTVLFVFLSGLFITACSSRPDDQPELAEVKGLVTLDSSPLVGVLVQYTPEEGRGSQALTDENGKYELMYVYPTMGAKVGSHTVTINTPPTDDSDPEAPKVKEVVPEKYRKNSILKAEVKPGENDISFDLQTR
ncbi:carboxypeptidase regulatory-like domain-containing protein [Gimesia sp.]|uniref:carboxypeptidase regulatory-like domain-containing protein n=1 Tax=Gimesia sp. TaxID=2024833 RepID=UPI003A90725D